MADVQRVFAGAGHAAIEEHEQEDELAADAAGEPLRKKQRTRVAKHHTHWFLSLADRLHAHGWGKKEVTWLVDSWCVEVRMPPSSVQTTLHRTHTRALFLAAHATCDYTFGSRPDDSL